MSVPYLPLYVADYEADTAHLTMEEDGAYTRLLRLCWRTPGCSIPADPEWIVRHMRISADDYQRVVTPIIAEFFKTDKARLFSPRLLAEKERVESVSKTRSEAGKKGGRPAISLKTNATDKSKPISKTKANGKHLEPYLELEPEKEEKEEGRDAPEYAFVGRVIRLTSADLGRWRKSYAAIPDFNAELTKADDYYAEHPPKDGKWFFLVSRWLEKANRDTQKTSSDRDAEIYRNVL